MFDETNSLIQHTSKQTALLKTKQKTLDPSQHSKQEKIRWKFLPVLLLFSYAFWRKLGFFFTAVDKIVVLCW